MNFTRMPLGRRKDLKPNILRIKRFRQPEVIRTEASVDYDWQYGAPLEGFPEDGFSVRWTASYMSQKDGLLKLSIGGDDGYRLFVNDKHITGDWGNHSYSSREVELPVEAGKEYSFRIEFLIISLQQLSVLKHPG